MVEELESIEPREKRRISLEKPELDLLLFAFLQELIYYKDAEGLLLRVPAVRIEEAGGWRLEAEAAGETIDPSRHRMWVDVKAITLHRFSLEETGRGWVWFAKTPAMLMVLTLRVMGRDTSSHDLDDSATAVSDSDHPQAAF
jgi:SHS2 domain-containing protein